MAVLAVGFASAEAVGQGRMPAAPANLRIGGTRLPALASWSDLTTTDRTDPLRPEASLSPDKLALRTKLRRTLALYYQRRLNTRDHNPWEIMHAVIGYGVHCTVLMNGPTGQPVSGAGWLCYNGPCKGDRMLVLEQGRVTARKGHFVQGHYGQFLAILAQSRVPQDFPMRVDGREFTVADLVQSEMLSCETGMELTFKLIALMHYLDSEAEWKNHAGQVWSIRRLIREEISSPIRGAACGGTHRLMGLAYAVQKRQLRGEPMDEEFLQAQEYLDQYHRYTFSLQNADGSFSTEWFVRRGDRADLDRRLQTTGHILEWLVFSLSDEQLDNPRVVRAVNYLADLLLAQPKKDWEIGTLHHGLHALALYEERRFATRAPTAKLDVAQRPEAARPTPPPTADKPATTQPAPAAAAPRDDRAPILPTDADAQHQPDPPSTPAAAEPANPPASNDPPSTAEPGASKPPPAGAPDADPAPPPPPPADESSRSATVPPPVAAPGPAVKPATPPRTLFDPPPLAPTEQPASRGGVLDLRPLEMDYNLLLGPNEHLPPPTELPTFDDADRAAPTVPMPRKPATNAGSVAPPSPADRPDPAPPPADNTDGPAFRTAARPDEGRPAVVPATPPPPTLQWRRATTKPPASPPQPK